MQHNPWGYPFVFLMNDYSDSDGQLLYTLQYRFKSTKSNRTYIVRVEKYLEHMYCVKFFDKANINSPNKFSLRTNTYEPRTILLTIYGIMQDVKNRDQKASFFFIGAADEKDEIELATRRFKFYSRFVSSTVSSKVYRHFSVAEQSLYILVDKTCNDNVEVLANRLLTEVSKTFS